MASMVKPRHASRIPRGTDIDTAHVGARLLGMPLKPQGERVAQLLEARRRTREPSALYQELVVQLPRRGTKTSSIFSTMVGRCHTRPGHRVVTTAQSGNVASQIIREHAQMLLARGHAVESRRRHKHPGRITFYANGGRERLEWPATDAEGRPIDVSSDDFDDMDDAEREGIRLGSQIWCVPPDAGAVRSRASDDIWIDEAGELDGQKGHDLLTGVLPLMDTRGPLAQLVVSGTPGRTRDGMFWELLDEARRGGPMAPAVLDYSAPDSSADIARLPDILAEPAAFRRLIRAVHPGVDSGLTTVQTMEKRLYRLGEVKFAREYLCIWPLDSSSAAVDMDAWSAAAVAQRPLPDRFGLAYDVAPDGSTAALAAGWRDDDGVGHVAILDYRMGVSWLAPTAHAVARKYRVPVRYDAIGANHGPAGDITRRRGVTLAPGRVSDAAAAAQLVVSNLADGLFTHADQGSLTSAAEGASWRNFEGGRVFGRRASDVDVCPIVAASLALYQYDQLPVRQPLRVLTTAS